MKTLTEYALIFIILAFQLRHSFAFNILLFLVGTNSFERQTFEFLAQQLARRHHNTITVKPILIPEEPRLVQPRLHFVTEKLLKDLIPKHLYESLQEVRGDVPWRERYEYDAFQEPYWAAHVYACKKMLNSNLMEVLARDQIDAAIVYAGNPCQLAIVWALNIPFVYFDVDGFSDETRLASSTPWLAGSAEFPLIIEPPRSLGDLASIFQYFRHRFARAFGLFCEFLAQEELEAFILKRLPCEKRVAQLDAPISKLFAEDYEIRRKFPSGFPTVNEIKRSADFYFLNTDLLIEPRESLPPNVLRVGGLHIDQPRPLFSPWNVTDAAHGIIIVSLGTQVDTSRMRERFVVALFNVLARCTKYRIYWRVAPKMSLPGLGDLGDGRNATQISLPPHINFTTFIPQNELLANRRTRLLVTNGGIHSVLEALTYGVPMLGIPLYGFNRQTLAKAERVNVALNVEKANLTERSLAWAMRELLYNPKYLNNAREASREIRRRPASAFEQALYAIEQVARRRVRAYTTRHTGRATRVFGVLLSLNADLWLAVLVSVSLTALILPRFLRFSLAFALHILRMLRVLASKLRKKSKFFSHHLLVNVEKKNK